MSAARHEPVITLLPDRLYWAPECSQKPPGIDGEFVPALQLCGPEGAAGAYKVEHYMPKAYGRAFGPLGLDQTLSFCSSLHERLGGSTDLDVCVDGAAVVLTSPPGQPGARTNAVVLIGVYLVSWLEWKASTVADTMGAAEAGRKFICSWASNAQPEPTRVLSVYDCWFAFQVARREGWVVPRGDDSGDGISSFCATYRRFVCSYDAAWIIPRLLLVCADPVTTLHDPNPETFTTLFPQEEAHLEPAPRDPSSDAQSRTGSVDSVCKEFQSFKPWAAGEVTRRKDFLSFLKEDCNVGLLIRTNFSNEPGMPAQSYDSVRMGDHGIDHVELQIVDKNGGLPKPEDIRRALEASVGFMSERGGAVGVHCKGGFGRSVVVACCLAVERFDIPGHALLAWVRIARPGAVNSLAQEEFIRSLTGGDAVRRFAGLARARCPPPFKELGCALQ